jgi:hypothetical protein
MLLARVACTDVVRMIGVVAGHDALLAEAAGTAECPSTSGSLVSEDQQIDVCRPHVLEHLLPRMGANDAVAARDR